MTRPAKTAEARALPPCFKALNVKKAPSMKIAVLRRVSQLFRSKKREGRGEALSEGTLILSKRAAEAAICGHEK